MINKYEITPFFPIQIVTCLLAAFLLTACNGINSGSNSGTQQYKDYKQAVKENDFEAAHGFLEEIYDEFLETWDDNFAGMKYDNDNRANIEAAATKYSRAATYVLPSGIITASYLDELRNQKAENKQEQSETT